MDKKRLLIYFLISLVIFGLLARFILIDNDFSVDEVDFVRPAISLKNTGHPVFYHSEQILNQTALWHPPMYIFTLSWAFRFVISELSARSINALFSILTAIIIFLFCSNFIKDGAGRIIGLISSSFFMINYYVLSSSILIDIDIFSMFFTFAFIYSILMHYKTQKNHFLVFASLALFFSLMNRYIISASCFFFIGIYYLIDKNLRKDLKKYIMTGVVAFLAFLLIWTLYIVFWEPGNFFSFLAHSARMGGEQFLDLKVYLASFLLNLAQLVRLITLPFAVLILLSINYFRKNRTKLTNVILLYVLPVFLLFVLVPRPAFGYPRYFISIMPGFLVLVSIFVYKKLKPLKIDYKIIFIVSLISILSFVLLLVLNPQLTSYSSNGLILATNLPDFAFNILVYAPIVLVLFAGGKDKKKLLLLALISLSILSSIYFDVKMLSHDPEIKEVGEYIKANTEEGELIIAPKAIGYYSGRRFYSNDNSKPKLDFSWRYLKSYFLKSLENREMDDEFFWDNGLFNGLDEPFPDLNNVSYVVLHNSLENRVPEKIIGKYFVYNLHQDFFDSQI